MSAPPKFGDIGKAARDVLNDDYPLTKVLSLNATTANGVAFKVEGASTSKGVSAFIETKFKHAATGVAVKEKWTTENVVQTELTVANKVVKNSSFGLIAACSPNRGLLNLTVKGDFKNEKFFGDFKVQKSGAASIGTSFAFKDWVFGAAVDLNGGNVNKHTLAASYSLGDAEVTTSVVNGANVNGSIFHQCNPDLKAGILFGWNKSSGDSSMAVGVRYQLDSEAFVKAKIDKSLQLGLSYTQVLRKGAKFTVAASTNTTRLGSDDHKIGAKLTLTA